MDPHRLRPLRWMSGLLAACALLIAGCGGSSSEAPSAERPTMHFVYVNWVEGIAITHLLDALLEDSLGVDVELSRVNGGGVAFSSVASGDADIFVEAWLPTTHQGPWSEYQDRLHKLGYTYRGTSVGLVVPDDAPIAHIRDLPAHRAALDGTIHGIEAGAAINEQTRQILDNNGIGGFRVVASSEPAMIAALRRAISQEELFVFAGWKPHWMWGQFDLRYLEGAQTSQTPVFGEPEDIYTLVRTGFEADFPAPVVRFLEQFEIDDAQLNSLMRDFRPESDKAPAVAARDWIRAHPEAVRTWLAAARTASESAPATDGPTGDA